MEIGILVFSPTQLRPIIEICNNLIARGIEKSTSMVAFMAMPPDFHPVVGVLVFYNGSEEEAKAYYEPLFKLNPLVNMTSMTPYEKVNGQMVGLFSRCQIIYSFYLKSIVA